MYGKYFHTLSDLEEYVTNVYPDAEVDSESVYDVPSLDTITIECLDAYSGERFILGYQMTLGETIDVYKEMWTKAFPNNVDDAKTHLEVRVS